mgnify:CR=1 FL=1|jgi:hypothetical protein
MKRKLVEGGFQPIPEGEQVVRIKEIDESDYQKFDKIVVTIEDAAGRTARVNYNFVNTDGTPNDTAEFVYSRMARAAMGDETLDEVDTADLIGKFVRVEIEHRTSSQGGTFANVKKWIGPGEPFEVKKTASNKSGSGGGATSTGEPPKKKTAAEILAEMKARKAAGK